MCVCVLGCLLPTNLSDAPPPHSRFKPDAVETVAKLRGELLEDVRSVGSPHGGRWRPWGAGNSAIAGVDANVFKMDGRIKGWGGEDDDFLARATRRMHVVRMREPYLVHIWHAKDCTHTTGKRRISCLGSLAEYEGSSLALLSNAMKAKSVEDFWGGDK